MSVAQVKKRFGELESYLGRDKEALRRLKLLKDDVNVLRTSLAAAEEKAEQAEAVKDLARKRADDAEIQASELRMENERLRMQLMTLDSQIRLRELRDQEANEDDGEVDEADVLAANDDHVASKRMLKALRRALPQCPMLKSKQSSRHNPTFLRQGFAEGWSHKSIWTLGAAVAIIAAHEGGITVIDPIGTTFVREGDPALSGMTTNFIRWFGKNFKDEFKSKRVYFGNSGPAELIDPNKEEMTEAFLSGDE